MAFCLPKPDSSGNKTCVWPKSKLLFAEKTGTFAPKDVSISGKRLLLFRISLNVFPNCIYCSGKRSFRTLFSLWLLSAKRRGRTIGRTSIWHKKVHDASRGYVSLSVCLETGHRVNKKIMAKLAGRRFFWLRRMVLRNKQIWENTIVILTKCYQTSDTFTVTPGSQHLLYNLCFPTSS